MSGKLKYLAVLKPQHLGLLLGLTLLTVAHPESLSASGMGWEGLGPGHGRMTAQFILKESWSRAVRTRKWRRLLGQTAGARLGRVWKAEGELRLYTAPCGL